MPLFALAGSDRPGGSPAGFSTVLHESSVTRVVHAAAMVAVTLDAAAMAAVTLDAAEIYSRTVPFWPLKARLAYLDQNRFHKK